uniref:LIM zinc-binding domain-containing protein n=1 Tax=Macrostomum lignano TaxID=282301 RepID=A0A1I8FL46_9PLAT
QCNNENQPQQQPPPIALACSQCSCALAGCRYVLLDDKEPACLSCFDSRLANTCAACGAKIGCDSKDRHWHEACFRCAGCSAQLAGSSFSVKSDAIYCLMCYETRFAERCSRCREAFKAGQRKFEFRSRQYHDSCFLCCECGAQIGGASFISGGGSGANDESAESFARRRRPYHSDCLVCGHCAKPLCGLKFTSHEDRPFCGDCYGELFARRCSACLKPITGFTGSSSSRSRQRDWHSQVLQLRPLRRQPGLAKAFCRWGRSCVLPSGGGVGGSGARQAHPPFFSLSGLPAAQRAANSSGCGGSRGSERGVAAAAAAADAAKSASTSVKILSRVSPAAGWHCQTEAHRRLELQDSRAAVQTHDSVLAAEPATGAGMGLAPQSRRPASGCRVRLHSNMSMPRNIGRPQRTSPSWGAALPSPVGRRFRCSPTRDSVLSAACPARDGAGHGVAAVGVEVVRAAPKGLSDGLACWKAHTCLLDSAEAGLHLVGDADPRPSGATMS